MNKVEAIMEIKQASKRLHITTTANIRIINALKTLGLRDKDLLEAGIHMDVWNVNGKTLLSRPPRSPSFEEANSP